MPAKISKNNNEKSENPFEITVLPLAPDEDELQRIKTHFQEWDIERGRYNNETIVVAQIVSWKFFFMHL